MSQLNDNPRSMFSSWGHVYCATASTSPSCAEHGTAVRSSCTPLADGPSARRDRAGSQLNRTGDHWHILVSGLPPAFRYGWRVDGPTGAGHRFDPSLVLLDPWATAISDGAVWGRGHERNAR